MNYNILEILHLPVDEQREIAKAILVNTKEIDSEAILDSETEEELNRRFAKIESGNYKSYSVDETKGMLKTKWKNASL